MIKGLNYYQSENATLRCNGDVEFVPRICVLLAACNGGLWLEEQVLSILKQIGVDVSIFISVDTSTDNTQDIAFHLSSIYEKVNVIPNREEIPGAAHNFFYLLRTVDFNSYDAVALSDQDDIWLPSKLRSAWHFLKYRGFDAYSSDVLAFWDTKLKIKLISKSASQTPFDFLFEAGGPGCTYVVSAICIEDLKKFMVRHYIGLLNIKYHDFLIYSYGRSSNWRWKIESGGYLLYRQHGQNYIGANYGIAGIQKRFKSSIWSDYLEQVDFNLRNFCPLEFRISIGFIFKNCLRFRRNWRESLIIALLLLYHIKKMKALR